MARVRTHSFRLRGRPLAAAGCATPPVVKRDYLEASGVARLGAHDLWPADGRRRRRRPSAANGHADRRQRAGGGGGGRGTARPHSRPPGRERARRAQPQRNCARRHRRMARRRARTASRPILPPICRQSRWSSSPTIEGGMRGGRVLERCTGSIGAVIASVSRSNPGNVARPAASWIATSLRSSR